MSTKNIMIVGVGGQGTLLASKLLGDVLLRQGYDVKVSEVHGMSQRGGSVVTYVKFGEKVYSPIIGQGEADIILAKGQGNYETLSGQGRHLFFSLLCKCDLFMGRFNVPRLTRMFVEEK